MMISAMRKQKGGWVALFLVALFVITGCADVKPYQPRNHREEGPQSGLFTGPQGEWVIYRSDAPAKEAEEKKKAESTPETGQSAPDGQPQNKPEAAPDSKQP